MPGSSDHTDKMFVLCDQRMRRIEGDVKAGASTTSRLAARIHDLELKEVGVQGKISALQAAVADVQDGLRRLKTTVQEQGKTLLKVQVVGGLIFLAIQGAAVFALKLMAESWAAKIAQIAAHGG